MHGLLHLLDLLLKHPDLLQQCLDLFAVVFVFNLEVINFILVLFPNGL